MARNGEYGVPLSTSLVIWIINPVSLSYMYGMSPSIPQIYHPKSSLTLSCDILSYVKDAVNFLFDYERSTQGQLIAGRYLKITVWQH